MIRRLSMLPTAAFLISLGGCGPSGGPTDVRPSGFGRLATPPSHLEYGQIFPYEGEPYPSEVIPAVIDDDKSSAIAFGECTVGACDLSVIATHTGDWNGTEQVITYSVGGTGSSATLDEDTCTSSVMTEIGVLCTKKKARNVLSISTASTCGVTVTASTQHKAWWLGIFNVSVQNVSFGLGRFGEVVKVSVASHLTLSVCPSAGGGGGGPSTGEDVCYDMYMVWRDEFGVIIAERYLDQICFKPTIFAT